MLSGSTQKVKEDNPLLFQLHANEAQYIGRIKEYEQAIRQYEGNEVKYKRQREELAKRLQDQEIAFMPSLKSADHRNNSSQPEKITIHVNKDGKYQKTVASSSGIATQINLKPPRRRCSTLIFKSICVIINNKSYMRTQEQRIRPSDFSRGLLQQEQRIRENLNFATHTNRSMRQDIEAARRKLNSSASTGLLRTHTIEGRNLVNVQPRPSRDNFSQSQTPQHTTHSLLFRKGAPEVPQENDDQLAQLRKELTISRRESEGLRQVVVQNDASARFAIGQLQSALQAARAQNERVRIAFQNASKHTHDEKDFKNQTKPDSECLRCPRLEGRIRDLQLQISELTRQLTNEQSKRSQLGKTNQAFQQSMSERLKSMEGWLTNSNQEILKLEQKNMELTRRLTEREQQLNQQITSITEQYYKANEGRQNATLEYKRISTEAEALEKQYRESSRQLAFFSRKIQALNAQLSSGQERDRTDVVVSLGQLQQRLGELRQRLEEKHSQNRELQGRLGQKDRSLQRLSQEYTSALQRVDQLQESQGNYKQKIQDLHTEIQKFKSPASLQNNQYFFKYSQLEQIIQVERQATIELEKELQVKQRTINDLKNHLQEATQSLHSFADRTEQSQENVRRLTQTVTTLTQENYIINEQYTQIRTVLIKKQQQDVSQGHEHYIAEKQELLRRLNQYQTALEEANKQPLAQYKRIGELQQLVSILKQEKSEYQSIITSGEFQRKQLQRQNEDINQQLIKHRQQLWQKDNKNNKENNTVDKLREEIAEIQQQNKDLKKQLRELSFQKQVQYNSLEKAQTYITTLLDQIKTQGVQQEQPLIIQNKQLINQKQAIVIQNQSLRTKLDNLEKSIKQKKSSTQSPLQQKQQKDTSYIIQLANLKIKNDQLYNQLVNAENFLVQYEQRVKILIIEEQKLRNNLSQEREAKDEIERVVLSKDTAIQRLNIQFSNEIANRDRMIQNLQKHQKESTHFQSPFINQGPSDSQQQIKEANKKIIILQNEKIQQERLINSIQTQTQQVIDHLRNDNFNLHQQIQQLVQQKQNLLNHLKRIEAYIVELEKQIEQSKAKIISSKNNTANINQELINENQTLIVKIKQLSAQRLEVANQKQALIRQIQKNNAENQSLRLKLSQKSLPKPQPSLAQTNQAQHLQLIALQAKNKEVYTHLESAEAFILDLQNQLSSLTQTEQSLRHSLAQEKNATESIESILSSKDTQIAQRDKVITDLKKELERTKLSINTMTLSSEADAKKSNNEIGAENNKINELEALVTSLKKERSQQQNIISTINIDREHIINQIETLNRQITKYQQHVCLKEENYDASSKEALRSVKYENQVLAKENRQLTIKIQQIHASLEKAENYIAEILEQGGPKITNVDAAQNARLRQQIQKQSLQKKQIQISLENQIKLKKELQIQVDQLNIFVRHIKTQFEKNAEQASRQLKILQDMSGAVPSKGQSKQLSPQKSFSKPIVEQHDITILKSKNNELYQHLANAENFIADQDKRIQTFIKQELELRNTIQNQIQAKHAALSMIHEKELEIERLRSELLEQLNEKDKAILQLRKNVEQASVKERNYSKEEDKRIVNLEILINNLRLERSHQENLISSFKQQMTTFEVQKDHDQNLAQRVALVEQQNQSLKKDINALLFENESHIKKLEDAENYIVTLHQQINQLPKTEEDTDILMNQKETLLTKLREVQNQIQVLQGQNQVRQNQNKELQSQNTDLIRYVHQLQEQIHNLNKKDQYLEQQRQSLLNEKSQLQRQNHILYQHAQQLSVERNSLIDQVNQLKQISTFAVQKDEQDLLKNVALIGQENQGLKQDINALLLENQTHIRNLEKAEDYIASLHSQINQLPKSEEKTEVLINQNERLLIKLKEVQNQIQVLQGQNKVVQNEKTNLIHHAHQLQEQNRIINNRGQQLELNNQALQIQITQLQQQNQQLSKDKESLIDKANKIDQLQQKLRTQFTQLQQNNQKQQLEHHINILQQNNKQLLKQRQAFFAQNLSLIGQNKQLTQQNKSLSDQIKQTIAKNQNIQINIRTLEQEVRSNQQKLQNQALQTQQKQKEVVQLTKSLAQSRGDLERNTKELTRLQEAHHALAKQMQNKLNEEIKKQPQIAQQSSSLPKQEIQQLKIQNKQLHEHLQGAEDHIFTLQKHLQALTKAQLQLKNALQQEKISKNQIEAAISTKQNEIKKLKSEIVNQKASIDPLQNKITQLQKEKEIVNERANYSESLLMDTVKELQELKSKLENSEKYIYDLEKEIDRLGHELAKAQKMINQLSQESNQLKQKVTEHPSQDKINELLQHIRSLQEQLRRLNAQKDINSGRLQSKDSEIQALSSQIVTLKSQIAQTSSKPESLEGANFFKNKLIQAEDYIATIENIQQTNQNIMRDQSLQLQAQAQKTNQLQQNLIVLRNQLGKAKQSEKKLQDNLKTQSSSPQVISLQNKAKELDAKLKSSEADRQKMLQNIDDLTREIQKSDQTVKSLSKAKTQAEAQTQQIKQKLQQAESQNLALQKQKSLAEQSKPQVQILLRENKAINDEVKALRNELKQAIQNAKFLQNKLLEAQTYITHIDQVLPITETKNKQLEAKLQQVEKINSDLNLSNKQLIQQINQLTAQIQPSKSKTDKNQQSPIQSADFFKDKLLEAESFIHELEQDNARLIADADERLKQLNIIKNERDLSQKLLTDVQRESKLQIDQQVQRREKGVQQQREPLLLALKETNVKLEDLIRTNQEKDQSINNLKVQLQNAVNSKPTFDQTKQQAQIESLKSQILQSSASIDPLLQRITKLQQQNEAINKRFNQSQAEIVNKTKELAQLHKKIQQAEATKPKVDEIKPILQAAEESIKVLEEENKNLRKNQQNNLSILVEKLDQVQKREEDLQSQLISAQKYIQKLEEDNFKITQDQKSLLKTAQELPKLKARLATLDHQILDADQQIKNLNNKLIISQDKSNKLEDENNKLREKVAQAEVHIDQQGNKLKARLSQAQKEIDTLAQQSSILKARLASTQQQPKNEDLKQQITVLHEQIRKLNIAKQINQQRLQSKQSQIRTLSSALQNLQKPKTDIKPQSLEEDALFFKNKLLEAEQYIEQMEHINITNENLINQSKEEMRQLAARVNGLQNALSNAEKNNTSINNELTNQKDLNRRLKEAASQQVSPTQIITLQNAKKDLQTKLAEIQNVNVKILQENKQHNAQLLQRDNLLKSLKQEKVSSDEKVQFFKNKLFQAESYITELEESSNTSQQLSSKLKENALLQDKLKQLKTALQVNKDESDIQKTKVATLQKQLKQAEEESQFFRKKLLEAETYINHIEQSLPSEDSKDEDFKQKIVEAEAIAKGWEAKAREAEGKNRELTLMNEGLLSQLSERRHSEEIQRLEDSLIQLRSALHQSEANNKSLKQKIEGEKSPQNRSLKDQSSIHDGADFFKQKLLEAESYIRQLEEENKKFGEKVDELNKLKEEYEETDRLLDEAQEKNNILAIELERAEHETEKGRTNVADLQQKVAYLTDQISNLEDNLTHQHNDIVKDLRDKLQQAESKLNDAQDNLQEVTNFKESAEERATRYEELSNSLQDTLNILDKIQRPQENNEIKAKLNEAERKIVELLAISEQKDAALATISDQLQQLESEQHKPHPDQQAIKEALQVRNTDLLHQNENLLASNKQLETANRQLEKQVATLQKALNHSQQQLQEEQGKNNLLQSIQLDESGKPIDKENEQEQKQNRKRKQEDTEKINDKNIQIGFLGDKLKQAQQLIVQQANEVANLTDEIVRLQNDSLSLKKHLSTRRKDEEALEEVIKELSNSRQDLVEKVEPLENANQQLRSQLRQDRVTIAQLEEDKDKAILEAEERLQILSTLKAQIQDLEESLKSKDEQIVALEADKEALKVSNAVAPQQDEENHQKFIELQAQIIHLKEENDKLEQSLQQLRPKIEDLNNKLTKKDGENEELTIKLEENIKKSQALVSDHQAVLQELNEIQSKKDRLASENKQLKKKLEEGLSESMKLSQEKQNTLNQQIDKLRDQLVAETIKSRDLEKQLANKQKQINQLRADSQTIEENAQIMEKAFSNLASAHEAQSLRLSQQLQTAQAQVASLKNELKAKETQIQQVTPLIQKKQELLKQSNDLKEELESLKNTKNANNQQLHTKLKQAEEYITELQSDADNATVVFKNLLANVDSLKQEAETLSEDLRRANAQKQKLLSEIKSIQEEMEMSQSDNERLKSKVTYLNSMNQLKDQEIANLSEISKEKEREIDRLHQSTDNVGESQPQQGNIIPDQYKQDIQEEENSVKELADQIRFLTAQLERKQEDNRQLMVQRVNLQGEIKDLQEMLANRDEETDQELRQHLVEADRANLELQEHNKALITQIESLGKDKAYLECQLNQLKAKPVTQQEKTQTQPPQEKNSTVPNTTINQNDQIQRLNGQIQQLRHQLQEQKAKAQQLLVIQVQYDSLKHIKQALQNKLSSTTAERDRLLTKLKQAEQAIAGLQASEQERRETEQQLARINSTLEQNLVEANTRINQLQSNTQNRQQQEALGENLKRLLNMTSLNQEIDQDITQHLQSYPYLNQFINSILYRLRLSSALELQKSLKIKQLTEELQNAQREIAEAKDLRSANDYLREEVLRLQSERKEKEQQEQVKYDQALQELLYYSNLNKQLEGKLSEITQIIQQQDKRIKEYEQQITPLDSSLPSQDNDLSQENYELRRKLQSSQRMVQKYRADSSSSLNSKDVFYMQFLRTCLDKVVDLEKEVHLVEREIEQTATENTQRSQPSIHQQDTLQDRLQELQEKLLRNAHNIREHQQRSDNELYELLRELSQVKELPEANRNRIEQYLSQLETQILKEHDQHQSEVSRLREQVASLSQQSARSNDTPADSPRGTREQLLREINHLNNAIQIYYQESMRRKKNYRRTIEALLRDIQRLTQRQQELIDQGKGDQALLAATGQMADRLRSTLQNEEDEDTKQLQLGDDFIISGNYMQILDGRDKAPLSALQQHFAQAREERETQTEEDPKPFLTFLLSAQNLEKEDLRLLKKKVAELRTREVEESLQALKGQERRLQEVLQLGNREAPQQLDNIILTLANTYSKDEISQIFGSQDNDELLNKLNQALCLQDSFYRGQNSSSMLRDILERKNRYYQSPTKLSEQVYTHLVNLLSAKRDQQFYQQVQALFHDLYQTQVGFQQALRKKDQLYQHHNQRMNQIFNRSSSDGSEEYMNMFDRENNENGEGLEMHSERKPRRSQPDSETEH